VARRTIFPAVVNKHVYKNCHTFIPAITPAGGGVNGSFDLVLFLLFGLFSTSIHRNNYQD
jgi:hypothetical protein